MSRYMSGINFRKYLKELYPELEEKLQEVHLNEFCRIIGFDLNPHSYSGYITDALWDHIKRNEHLHTWWVL